MRALDVWDPSQDAADFFHEFRRSLGELLQGLLVIGPQVLLQIGFADADAATHANGAQLPRLDVAAHRDGMHL